MEDAHTTYEESAGEYHFPDSSGSSEIGFPSQDVPFSNYAHEHLWSPVCLSSPSASTDYLSNNPTPFTTPLTRLADSLPDDGYSYEARSSLRYSSSDTSTATWCEQLSWSEPSPLEDCINRHFNDSTSDGCVIDDAVSSEPIPETPDEHVDSLPQDEVDKNTREMTCGPKVEEHFWPIRYRIRSGKFQLYENTINALIVHARKELQPAMHGRLSKLTNELASRRVESSSSLTSFLDESRSLYERLWQIAGEMRATELQRFRDTVWGDSLMIILVFYEILTSKADVEDIMKLRGTKAQFMLDLMQDAIRTHIDLVHLLRGGAPRIRGARRSFLMDLIELGLLRHVDRAAAQIDVRRLIVQLSESSGLLPSSLAIRGVEHISPMPVFGGNFGDIFGAQCQGNVVALKRLRLFPAESDENVRIRRKFCREALIWKNLDHDYVLPFLGVDSETFPGFLCMVSPWMSRGSLVNNNVGPCQSSIPVLIYEIAVGLQYLHSQNIVHGDLRGANILLDDQGHARLADFGLTVFADGPLAPTNRGGSARWMAPELLDPKSCGLDVFKRTFASDIYSFACVCLELYTGEPPFSKIFSDGAVLLKVISGDRPECPSIVPVWCQQLITKCWSHSPFKRPGTGTIIESIVTSVRKRPRSPEGFEPSENPMDKRRKIFEADPVGVASSDVHPR